MKLSIIDLFGLFVCFYLASNSFYYSTLFVLSVKLMDALNEIYRLNKK